MDEKDGEEKGEKKDIKEPPILYKKNGKILYRRKIFNIKEELKDKETEETETSAPEKQEPDPSPAISKVPLPPQSLPLAPILPNPNQRPSVIPGRGQNIGPQEAGVATVARTLGPQLASDQRHLMQLIIDERKLAVLNDFTQVSVGYFLYRGQVDEIRFWNYIANWELVSSQAIDGRGRNDILKAIAYSASGKPQEVAKKPHMLARNTYARNWKVQAAREGKEVVEE